MGSDLKVNLPLLPADQVKIKKVGYVNYLEKADSVVRAISFHNSLPIFLTGAYDKLVRVYEIKKDEKNEGEEIIKVYS